MWRPTYPNIGSTAKVFCDDGKVRTARVTAHADTWFSLPATVKVNGKNVSGYISGGRVVKYTMAEIIAGTPDYTIPDVRTFSAYLYRCNHAQIVKTTITEAMIKEAIAAHPEIAATG